MSLNQPERFVDTSKWNIPTEIDLADPGFYMPHKIDLLISTQEFFDLLLNGKISLDPGLPCLVNTALGWIVGEKVSEIPQSQIVTCNMARSTELPDALERFWLIEEFDSHHNCFTVEEEDCERHYLANTKFLTSGRVQVCLPFKENPHKLGKSFQIAKSRFLQNERRLSRNPLIREM
ncbi:uncharacterized protein LOC128260256 [Drosophila gunungcola]|uniref:uncharacterized protein LOC128260256 n=1 Tax=Drosophila gunungcola TaxID=103775 RepID=UPI0022E2F1B7|nr:uncharacterized protein LOC128260256 [Drosophila gunungcola]